MTELTYKSSGVDIEAGNKLVAKIKPFTKSTNRDGVVSNIGGFGALFELDLNKYKSPLLVSATDGVGTKLKLAEMLGKHDTIGIDLVAMCVNDLIVQGAEPLFFLDYYATGKLNIDLATAVIKGIAAGCKQANCALIGGETAEMPSMYNNEEYDLAGFCVGAVEKEKVITGDNVAENNVIIAIESSGPHSNGYSLIRKILEKEKNPSINLDTLIEPTKIYVRTILNLIAKIKVNAIAHITGGGILENIPRVIKQDLCAVIDTQTWQIPEVFNWLQEKGNVNTNEMYRVFNCGVGMVVIVAAKDADNTIDILTSSGESAWLIGHIEKVKNTNIKII